MKTTKHISLLIISIICMASCNFNSPVKEGNHQALHSYIGTSVIDSGYYESEATVVDFITSDSIAGAYMVYFHDTKFAEKMPQMDIIIDGIVCTAPNTYQCDSIVPDMVMGIMRIPVPKYLIRNLKLFITSDNMGTHMNMHMLCGPYNLDYTGTYEGD